MCAFCRLSHPNEILQKTCLQQPQNLYRYMVYNVGYNSVSLMKNSATMIAVGTLFPLNVIWHLMFDSWPRAHFTQVFQSHLCSLWDSWAILRNLPKEQFLLRPSTKYLIFPHQSSISSAIEYQWYNGLVQPQDILSSVYVVHDYFTYLVCDWLFSFSGWIGPL